MHSSNIFLKHIFCSNLYALLFSFVDGCCFALLQCLSAAVIEAYNIVPNLVDLLPCSPLKPIEYLILIKC